jgi:CRISPR-associated protein Csm5
MRYKVTALTPVLVGDGNELSPIDYMVWKDQVNVLDQPRIFKLLARGPRLDSYLAQLRKATKLDFASWGGFAQNFSQRRIPFEHPEAATAWNSAPAESLFIPTFAADHRGAYLPSSALKGALRTSIVFSRWAASTIDGIAAAMASDRVPRRLAEPAEVSSGASQVKILSVADSQPVSASAFKIFLTRVASLDTRQPGKPQLAWKVAGRGSVATEKISQATPVFAEMAPPGTEFFGEWEERTFLEKPELTHALGWRSVPEPKLILDAANEHAATQLELHARYAETTGLEGLRQAVQGLNQELLSSRNLLGSCLLCLGWGSGFLSKVGFLQTEQESYRKILRAVAGFGKAIREGVPFPKTRRIVFAGAQPSTLPGWVRLQLEQ